MITTLRAGKARFSALVELASRGEDVVITVHGKPKARLKAMAPRRTERESRTQWLRELKSLRTRHSRRPAGADADVIRAIREDRA